MDSDARMGKDWPLWAYALVTAVLVAIPLVFAAFRSPVAAAVCWVGVVCVYLLGLALFGKGSVIELGCASFILATLAALIIFLATRGPQHDQRAVGASVGSRTSGWVAT